MPQNAALELCAQEPIRVPARLHATNAGSRAALREPGMDLVTKPFTLEVLSQQIRQLIACR